MIRWHQTHSGMFASVTLAVSILVFYLIIALPWHAPELIAGIFYFIPAALFVAVIDHGHVETPWRRRIWRLLASWVMTVIWMIVGAGMVATLSGATFTLGRTWSDIWSTLWPMFVTGAVLAWLGLIIIRWMERQVDPFRKPLPPPPLLQVVRRDNMGTGHWPN